MAKKPVMLMILDGWGLGEDYPGNAIYRGKTENFDRLMRDYPNTRLAASGLAVGLPEGQMGNSEVGHLNIGGGRIVYQDLPRISKDIEDGSFFKKEVFLKGIENTKKNKSKIHLIGLVSDGGVHSHIEHLYGLLKLMKDKGQKEVYIHAILDGRDVPPKAGKGHMEELEARMKKIGSGRIASVSGRYYSMDRDKRWDRTKLAYEAMVLGKGKYSDNSISAIEESYEEGVNDEFILPRVMMDGNKPVATIEDGDSIIFFNFRPDRVRQITRAFVDKNFSGFAREKEVDTFYITMTEYDKTIENVHIAYESIIPKNTLSEYISRKGLSQLKIAETEKYGHVTFFFNGGIEEPYPKEDRVLIDSPRVATYDLEPEMSAYGVKEELINRINMDKYNLIIANFANPDMVGHTGIIPAVIKAVETVDICLGQVLDLMEEKEGTVLITADHGNAEKLLDQEGNPVTAHTTNDVPLILFTREKLGLREGKLADLAPSILDLMGMEKPEEMTGQSLIVRNND